MASLGHNGVRSQRALRDLCNFILGHSSGGEMSSRHFMLMSPCRQSHRPLTLATQPCRSSPARGPSSVRRRDDHALVAVQMLV
jgi:hypothetical protein